MSRPAILAAAVALFCLPFPSVVRAQRIVPRHSIIQKPVDSTATRDVTNKPAAAAVAPGTGSIMGAALDSLHEEMLVHAGVTVMGLAGRHAVTTDAGAFRIDSLPPGKYVLEVT
ncbi:MAG TPA: carboxypeptidase-like regulatory domain-containing protein, partial [Gemmatimonadaceae bacterium]|nr:carboxypeptidase-like regulatory domain-containing protein [Gemmatimonadaceae bacterium]